MAYLYSSVFCTNQNIVTPKDITKVYHIYLCLSLLSLLLRLSIYFYVYVLTIELNCIDTLFWHFWNAIHGFLKYFSYTIVTVLIFAERQHFQWWSQTTDLVQSSWTTSWQIHDSWYFNSSSNRLSTQVFIWCFQPQTFLDFAEENMNLKVSAPVSQWLPF